jgi:hypothetical protein
MQLLDLNPKLVAVRLNEKEKYKRRKNKILF